MKLADMKSKTAEQLDKHVQKLQEQVAELYRDRLTSDKQNVHEARMLRKEIAQALTVKNQLKNQPKADKKEEK